MTAHATSPPGRATAVLAPLCAILLMAPGVQAQTTQDQAKTHYKAGVKAAITEDYVEAIYQFKQGHKLAPNGLFTYNLAIAYIRIANFEEALRYAKQTHDRAEDLDSEQRARNDARLIALNMHSGMPNIAREIENASKAAEPVADTTPSNPPPEFVEEEPDAPALTPSPTVVTQNTKPQPRFSRIEKIGWSMMIIGAVGGTGIYWRENLVFDRAAAFQDDYGYRIDGGPTGRETSAEVVSDGERYYATSDCDNLQTTDQSSQASVSERDACKKIIEQYEYSSLRRISGVSVGVAMIGTGAAIVLTDAIVQARDNKQRARLVPMLSPTAAGMGLHVRF